MKLTGAQTMHRPANERLTAEGSSAEEDRNAQEFAPHANVESLHVAL